jgi:phage baseplate assembly protein V
MTASRLLNSLRAHSQMAGQGRGSMRLGLVTSYDPATYSVKVSMQPDNVESGWIPVAAQAVGNGWGILTPPRIGDQILVLMQDSDPEAGVAAWCLFNNVDVPPAVPSGEFWMMHKTGSYLKFLTDGSVDMHVAKNLTASVAGTTQITATGAVTLTAQADVTATIAGKLSATATGTGTLSASSWSITGNVSLTGTFTATGDVIGKGHNLSTHVHSGVTSGSSNSGTPIG